MIKNCGYTESTDTMVQDRLVFGIRDAKVQGQLLHIGVEKLTLEKALSHCSSAEVKGNKKPLSGKGSSGHVNWPQTRQRKAQL